MKPMKAVKTQGAEDKCLYSLPPVDALGFIEPKRCGWEIHKQSLNKISQHALNNFF